MCHAVVSSATAVVGSVQQHTLQLFLAHLGIDIVLELRLQVEFIFHTAMGLTSLVRIEADGCAERVVLEKPICHGLCYKRDPVRYC